MGSYLVGVGRGILDCLIKLDLSGQEIRVVLVIIRESPPTLSKIVSLFGCSKARCSRIVKKLVFMKIVTVDEDISGVKKTFVVNENTAQWMNVYKKRYEKTVDNKSNG